LTVYIYSIKQSALPIFHFYSCNKMTSLNLLVPNWGHFKLRSHFFKVAIKCVGSRRTYKEWSEKWHRWENVHHESQVLEKRFIKLKLLQLFLWKSHFWSIEITTPNTWRVKFGFCQILEKSAKWISFFFDWQNKSKLFLKKILLKIHQISHWEKVSILFQIIEKNPCVS
jgi:hypothetical protein